MGGGRGKKRKPVAEEEQYVVEEIVDVRFDKATYQLQYQVKWLNYPSTENTWENENVKNNKVRLKYDANHRSEINTIIIEELCKGMDELVVGTPAAENDEFMQALGEEFAYDEWKVIKFGNGGHHVVGPRSYVPQMDQELMEPRDIAPVEVPSPDQRSEIDQEEDNDRMLDNEDSFRLSRTTNSDGHSPPEADVNGLDNENGSVNGNTTDSNAVLNSANAMEEDERGVIDNVYVPSSPEDYETTAQDTQNRLNEWIAKANATCEEDKEARLHVENTVDNAVLPYDFKYTCRLIYSESAKKPNDIIIGCDCRRGQGRSCGTNKSNCCPKGMDAQFAYKRDRHGDGLLTLQPGRPIYECNRLCPCNDNCLNKVIQRGRKQELCIFRTEKCGWGVKAVSNIEKGRFITDYTGEILSVAAAKERKDRRYSFDFDFEPGKRVEYVIDAKFYGNIARFINHSCEPNVAKYCAWTHHWENSMPRIVFFAKKDIRAGEELLVDYHEKFPGQESAENASDVNTSVAGNDDLNTSQTSIADGVEAEMDDCICGADICKHPKFPKPKD